MEIVMTEQERKVVGWAHNNTFTAASIATFYQNVKKNAGFSVALDAIKARMRTDFPGQAKKMFGAKEEEVVERLTRVAAAATRDFLLQDNRVGTHVKTGGAEISGMHFLSRYISYKNAHNQGAGLSIEQQTPESEIRVFVSRYRTNAGEGNFNDPMQFSFIEFDKAEALYRQHLAALAHA
jgi:hypothetical protein